MVTASKSEVKANLYRSKGNVYYRKHEYERALAYYNSSILVAPYRAPMSDHLQKCDIENEGASGFKEDHIPSTNLAVGDFKTLSLGYANRSAVLLELKQYAKCLCDLDLAFSYGYPLNQHVKLLQRKIKCHIALNNISVAREIILSTLKGLGSFALDEIEFERTKKNLSLLYQKCLLVIDSNTKMVTPGLEKITLSHLATLKDHQLLFTSKTSEQPHLAKPNLTFPALSNAIKVTYKPMQGRQLVAQRDIHPGETLLVEESFASVLQSEIYLSSYCSSCFLQCLTPHPCPDCTLAIFCSKSCQLQGITGHHERECKILNTLISLKVSFQMLLAIRILIKVSYSQLKQRVPHLHEKEKNQNPRKKGLNKKGIYDPSDVVSVYHLLMGDICIPKEEFTKVVMESFILTKLLEASEKFFINGDVPITPSQEDFVYTAFVLLQIFCGLGSHARQLTECKVNVKTKVINLVPFGLGIFPTLSLVKHSCHKVSVPTIIGDTVVLKSVTLIKAGEEITQCNEIHFDEIPKMHRQMMIMDKYNIICKCKACENNWPLYRDLPGIIPKCTNCNMSANIKKGKCHKCKKAKPVLTPQLMRGLSLLKSTFKSDEDALLVNSTDEERKVVCNVIEELEKQVLVPCQDYINAQNLLCYLILMDGSHSFITHKLITEPYTNFPKTFW